VKKRTKKSALHADFSFPRRQNATSADDRTPGQTEMPREAASEMWGEPRFPAATR